MTFTLSTLAMGMTTNLTTIDWLIMLVYFVFVLGIGFALKRYMRTSNDFFLAGRSIPAWVCGLAFISANLGAQEVIGMGASGAKYGIVTSQFYWIGAIPAMVFVGLFMMPFYYGSKARSVPEYLRLRFDEKTRALNAGLIRDHDGVFLRHLDVRDGAADPDAACVRRAVSAFRAAAGVDLSLSRLFSSAMIVLGYIFLGGLTSAIYNEVLQFFLIVAGFLPLVWIGLKNVGGWHGIQRTLGPAYTHSWRGMAHANTNPLGVEWFALVMGLGFVLSLWLLVHGFSGDPARDGCGLGAGGAAGAADCCDPEDVLSVSGDSAGTDRNFCSHRVATFHCSGADRCRLRTRGDLVDCRWLDSRRPGIDSGRSWIAISGRC